MFETFWLFHCGYLRIPARFLVAGDPLELRKLPFLAALGIHEEHGPILFDAPFGHEGPQNAGELLGSLLKKGGMTFERDWGVIGRLEQIGMRPAEIAAVCLTHLHWDHTGGLKHLAHSRFHVSAEEWGIASGLSPIEGKTRGYVPTDYRALESRLVLHDLEGHEPVTGGIDVLGDGSLEVVSLPGHTPGHVGYRLKMMDGRTIFHVGDAIFCRNQVTQRRDLGFMPRTIAAEKERVRETLRELRKWHADNEEVVLVSSHDYDLAEDCFDGPIVI